MNEIEADQTTQTLSDRTQARYRALVEASSQIVFTADERGNWGDSPSWRAFTGQTRKECQGLGWLDAVHAEDRERAEQLWRQAITAKTNYQASYRVRAADQTDRHMLALAVPVFDDDGRILEWAGMYRDVTLETRIEERRQRESRRKEEFLDLLGHELRNPLAGLTGAVQVLEALGLKEAEAGEMLEILQRQTAQMSRLIEDLLDVSRIARGKVELRREPLDLGEFARQVCEDFRLLEAQGSTLQFDEPKQPLWVNADRARLTQVLVNLLQNAVKYTDAGGSVFVELSGDAAGQVACLRVRDTGIGMSGEFMACVFEPYIQAENGERSHGGLGLGLALVKGLVELHGGQVRASSPGEGLGSQFEVRLPLMKQPAQSISQPEPPRESQASIRILIIDDSRDAAYPVEMLLVRLGHNVRVAADGPSGVNAAKEFLPDVVLCDIGLPGMNGFDVAAALRADQATRSAVLVAATGYAGEEDRVRALEAGFDRHLIKPVGLETLKSLLEDLPAARS